MKVFKLSLVLLIVISVAGLYSCKEKTGCTEPEALNYNFEAEVDDGSCIIPGCTDTLARNYNPRANFDDGSCVYSDTVLARMGFYTNDASLGDIEVYVASEYKGTITGTTPRPAKCTDPNVLIVEMPPGSYRVEAFSESTKIEWDLNGVIFELGYCKTLLLK